MKRIAFSLSFFGILHALHYSSLNYNIVQSQNQVSKYYSSTSSIFTVASPTNIYKYYTPIAFTEEMQILLRQASTLIGIMLRSILREAQETTKTRFPGVQ